MTKRNAPHPSRIFRPSLCPACDGELVVLQLAEAQIDRCVTCRGIWLDAGELELIVAGKAGTASGRLRELLRKGHEEKSTRRRCPRCHRRLRQLALESKPPVVVDRCTKGHGAWLDEGELESLVRNFHEGEAGAVSEFLADLFRHELQSRSQEARKQ